MPAIFDVDAFITKNKTALSAEELEGITELRKGYMRSDDYQKNFNKLKADVAGELKANDDYAAKLKVWEDEHRELLDLKAGVEARFGDISQFRATADPSKLRTPSGDFVNRTDVAKLESTIAKLQADLQETRGNLNNFATGSMGLIGKLPELSDAYRTKYKKPLNSVKFLEFVNEHNIVDIDQGFQLFTFPDEQKFLEEKHRAEIVAAKEEAVRNFATTHHIPEDGGRRGIKPSPLFPPRNPVVAPRLTTPPAPPAAPPVPVAPVAPPVAPQQPYIAAASQAAGDLASRMQAAFNANKDK